MNDYWSNRLINILSRRYFFGDKIRVGKDFDGGYIICRLPVKYDRLLSCGILDDVSFENHFLKLYPDTSSVFSFDGTIENLPVEAKEEITFVKKNIGFNLNDDTLFDKINSSLNPFLKMDIEGAEWEWLEKIPLETLDKLKQICIEFHYINNGGKVKLLEKLSKTHYLVHIHGNNTDRCIPRNGVGIPQILECTYIHKDFLKNPILSRESFPSDLDMPNLKGKPDIKLEF